jgi:Phage tail assembly chaperone protein, TAC
MLRLAPDDFWSMTPRELDAALRGAFGNNGDTLNGISLLNGDHVFLAFQTNPAENGIWVVFTTPFRTPDFPTYDDHTGALISVVAGTLYAGSIWQCTSGIGGTLDASALNFALRVAGPPPFLFPGGRLTNSSGVPVPTSDVAGAATIYYAPYLHRLVPIFDGVQFVPTDIGGELSQALSDTTKSPAAAANNSNYDLFVWNDAGTLRCTRGPLWSSGTARGTGAGTTELERVRGIWVNKIAITNGPAAQRGTYVGSVRTNGSAQVDFTPTGTPPRLMVWNAYNRRPAFAKRIESTDSWAYATASFQQANASANNQIEALYGLSEDAVDVTVNHYVGNGGSGAGESMGTGIGLDSTSVDSAVINKFCTLTNASWAIAISAKYVGVPGLGYHYFAWLERGSTHATFYGDNFFGLPVKSGIAYRGEH